MTMVPTTPVRHLPAPTEGVTIDREAVLKALNLPPNDPKTHALLLVCERYNLDPLLKHMVLISGNAYVTRDGYLAIAHRSGQFDGMEVLEQGETPTHYTAKVAVYRRDMSRPFAFVGRFPKSKSMAKEYGPEMAVKVAEVQALRRAFNVTGIAAADEQWEDAAPATEPYVPPQPAEAVELADDWDRQSISARIERLDDEHRAMFAARWKETALPPMREPSFNKDHVAHALNLLTVLEAEAAETYDRRRKHVNAKLTEVGIKSDDGRHDAIAAATDGRTSSSKKLTQADVDVIVAYCAELAAADAAAEKAAS